MLYHGECGLLGTPSDFQTSPDPIVQQFIHGHAEGPMDA